MSEAFTRIKERYESVCERIAAAAERSGRAAEDVTLVAVTKYTDMATVQALYDLGHRDFGESRAQQLVERVEACDRWATGMGQESDFRWHMIGHLQRNKVRIVLPVADVIHSLDSVRLADELERRAGERGRMVDVLLQVNASGEDAKYGVDPARMDELIDHVAGLEHVRVRGLMTMAARWDGVEKARPTFVKTADIFQQMQSALGATSCDILSMGMTDDFEVAIECGATHVRVGRALCPPVLG